MSHKAAAYTDVVDARTSRPSAPAIVIIAMPLEADRCHARESIRGDGVVTIEVCQYRELITALATKGASAILCDETVRWRDVLSQIAPMIEPPRVIVATSTADPALSAEILNLGAFDVLVKPLQQNEVRSVVRVACSGLPGPVVRKKEVGREINVLSFEQAG